MTRTKNGAVVGALTALALMLGASAFVPAASAEVQPHGEIRDLPGAIDLTGEHPDRPGVERNCTVTQRTLTDSDSDGNAEFIYIAVACREAADLNHNGTMDAWRRTEANFTRVDRNDDKAAELAELFVDATTTVDRNEDGAMDAQRADHIRVAVVDRDSDGYPDAVTKSHAARFSADRDMDGTTEVSGYETATLSAADTLGRPALDVFEFSKEARVTRFGDRSADNPIAAAGYDITARAADRDGDGQVDIKRVEASRFGYIDRNADGNPELAGREHIEAGAADRNYDGRFDVFALNVSRGFASDRNSDGNPEVQAHEGLVVFAVDRDFDGDLDFAKLVGHKVVLLDPNSDGVIDRVYRTSWERVFYDIDHERRDGRTAIVDEPARALDEPTDVPEELPPLDEAPADR